MSTPCPRPRYQRALLSSATAATLALTLSACGGSDDADATDTSQPSTQSAETEQASGAAGKSLPEGFPEDVPLPAHDEIKTASSLGEGTWRLMLLVDPDDEGSLEAYAAQLTDAGFEVTTSAPIVSGNNDSWSVDAVIRPPTITLQVITRDAQ